MSLPFVYVHRTAIHGKSEVQWRYFTPQEGQDLSDLVVRPSTKLLKAAYAFAAGLVIAIAVIDAQAEASLIWLQIIPAAIVAWALTRHIGKRFQSLTLAAGRLRHETGMVSKKTRTMEITRVQDVSIEQTLMQRLTGTGNITVQSAGETGYIAMHNIDRPQSVADRILEAARR